jgi:hypothetical protein
MQPRRVHIVFSCSQAEVRVYAHRPAAICRPARHRAPALLSEISEGKRGRNKQPGADQQGEGDTAEDR